MAFTGRGVGRLIGGALYYISPPKRCVLRNSYGFPNFRSSPSSQIAQFTEYTRCKFYEMEEEAGGSDSNRAKFDISKGDIVNMHDLLFTNNRDYLVKYNNQQVKDKQLAGKVIAILFVPLLDRISPRFENKLLTEVYNDLVLNNGFEVVFVAVDDVNDGNNENSLRTDSHTLFLEMFSSMPWTAIPFSDIPSKNLLQRRFGFPERVGICKSVLIVDSMGIVLQYNDSLEIIELYGALGYPFSDKRIEYLKSEDSAAAMQPSLNKILASPQRDYLISNKGEKVPIRTLEDKVVAILFYMKEALDDGCIGCLKMAYEELARNKETFEVVLVYHTDIRDAENCTDEESFWKTFKTMPWLAVPYKDPVIKKLKRIFEFFPQVDMEPYYLPYMVIFGPRGEFVEPFGERILDQFGVPAYPFTRAKVAKLHANKVKHLKLELLWDTNTVFRRENGSQVPFSQLLEKRVIIIFERRWNLRIRFLKMLKQIYSLRKDTCDEFEVIHIVNEKIESGIQLLSGDMPWLISPASDLLSSDFDLMYGFYSESSILAFDNGRVVRHTYYPSIDCMEFPFCGLDLEDEALAQLNTDNMWNYWDYYTNGGQVYAVRDKLLKVR